METQGCSAKPGGDRKQDLSNARATCTCSTHWTCGSSARRSRAFEARPYWWHKCDDFVIGFEQRDNVQWVTNVVGKRMVRFGLRLHPEKTGLGSLRSNAPWGVDSVVGRGGPA